MKVAFILFLHFLVSIKGQKITQYENTVEIKNSKKTDVILKQYPNLAKNPKKLNECLNLTAGPFKIKNTKKHNMPVGSHGWSYGMNGEDWPSLYESCAGRRQSPIELSSDSACQLLFRLPKLKFVNYYKTHPKMKISNNGHTVKVSGPWGLNGRDVPTMSGGPLNGSYRLQEVHFHWGYDQFDGSEHRIDGQIFSLEAHFVHFNTMFCNISEAIKSRGSESLAVVGVLFKYAKATTSDALEIFTTLKQAAAENIIFPAFFPIHLIESMGSYFTYLGSLTVPKCREVVRWIVFADVLNVSLNDLAVFKSFYNNRDPIKGNFRILQPLNGRMIIKSTT